MGKVKKKLDDIYPQLGGMCMTCLEVTCRSYLIGKKKTFEPNADDCDHVVRGCHCLGRHGNIVWRTLTRDNAIIFSRVFNRPKGMNF